MAASMANTCDENPGLGIGDLWPCWGAQVTRVRAPCKGAAAFERHRAGLVVGPGELMQALGQDFSAKQVCYFYRALRVVALKRPKNSSSQGLCWRRWRHGRGRPPGGGFAVAPPQQ